MKLAIFVLFCFAAYTCLADTFQPQFEASLQAWQNLDLQNYKYTMVLYFPNQEAVGRSTITVKNGKVTARNFVENAYFHVPGVNIDQWTEMCSQVGTHTGQLDYFDIVPAVLLDDVYSYCESILPAEFTPGDDDSDQGDFETTPDGLISKCAVYPALCFGCETILYVESIDY